MSIPKSLVEAVREHRVVPFVGAGVSVGVKRDLFPAWTRLLEELAEFMEAERVDAREVTRVRGLVMANELVLAAEVAHRALGPYLFHGFLRTHYRRQLPPDANLEVVRGIWALRPPLVITTNYDSALRWGGPAEVSIVANDQHEELALIGQEATSEWPWIWHLHGTIERLATVILAGRDYKRLYEKDERNRVASYERALFELQKTLSSRSLLYVGFGLTDPYVLEQIAHVIELSRGSVAPSYALMKQGQGNRADLWENYNIRLIEYADHGAPLAELLQALGAEAFGAPEAATSEPGISPAAVAFGVKAAPAPADERPRDVDGSSGPAPTVPPAAQDHNLGPGGGTSMGAPQAAPAPVRSSVTRPPQRTRHEDAPNPAKPIIQRTHLVDDLGGALLRSRRLLLLAPLGGGVRRLAEQIARQHFGAHVTWLSPPRVPDCTEAEYCQTLAGDERMDDWFALHDWLMERGRTGGHSHLVVLRHDGGPLQHLGRLGDMLRTLIEQPGASGPQIHVLVAGEAATARLRYQALETSLFAGAPVRHVPAFSVDEVAQVLTLAGRDGGRAAQGVWQATGGLPGLVVEAISGERDLDHASVTARLARSTAVLGRLQRRLLDDDRAQVPAERHARAVLQALLEGRAASPLDRVEDDLGQAEVRLYYDGLVAGGQGETRFLCEAVRRAAAEMLAHEPGRP